MSNVGLQPIAVMPVQSGHGDVHQFIIARANGDSLTVEELRRVHFLLTGKTLADRDIPMDWFAEEDR